MEEKKGLRYWLWMMALSLFLLPMVLQVLGVKGPMELKGYFAKAERPSLSIRTWADESFQEDCQSYQKDHIGLRSMMVRIYNQMQYGLNGETNAQGVVIGKEGYLFEQVYLDSYSGKDFVGQEKIDTNIERYAAVQDTLHKLGTEMLILIAPGKAAFYPEYLPEGVDKALDGQNNYEAYSRAFSEAGFNVLDLHTHFRRIKEKSPFPLVPKNGIHWSVYGEFLAADTLLQYLSELIGKPMAHVQLDEMESSSRMRVRDEDVEESMNLLFDLPDLEMGYPEFQIVADLDEKPRVVVASDSYYWALFNLGFSSQALGGGEFWYYGKQIIPSREAGPEEVGDLDIVEEVLANEALVFLTTDYNLNQFGYGIIDRLYEVFYLEKGALTDVHERKVQEVIERIKSDIAWLEVVKEQALKENISLEKALRNNAEYVIFNTTD